MAPKKGYGDLPTKGLACHEIHDEAYIAEDEVPHGGWASSPVHDLVGDILDGPDPILSKVLVLMVGFGKVVLDVVEAEQVHSSVAIGCFSPIGDECLHCSPFLDVVLKGSGDLGLATEWVCIRDQCLPTNI